MMISGAWVINPLISPTEDFRGLARVSKDRSS